MMVRGVVVVVIGVVAIVARAFDRRTLGAGDAGDRRLLLMMEAQPGLREQVEQGGQEKGPAALEHSVSYTLAA